MNTLDRIQDDIDRIMEVMTAAFDPAFGEAWTRRQVLDALTLGNCHFHVLDFDGEAAGDGTPAAGFYMSRNAFDEEELLLLAVSPQARRRGIGARLLKLFAENAQTRGVTRLVLEMRDGNPAEFLYLGAGFEPIGRRPKYYRGPGGIRIDAITFERRLDKRPE